MTFQKSNPDNPKDTSELTEIYVRLSLPDKTTDYDSRKLFKLLNDVA